MKIILLITSWFFSMTIVGQTNFEQSILGKWELQPWIDKESIIPINISEKSSERDNGDSRPNDIFFFQKNGMVDIQEGGEHHKYSFQISDSTLMLGNATYKIARFIDDSLSLIKIGLLLDENLLLIRSKKTIVPIEIEQIVQSRYSSGQLKLSGQKLRGFQNGIWTEWYENGSVKSVTHYQMDVPFMKIEFDKEGNITSKSWYDLESKRMKSE